jgi:hypothetical protein
MEHEARGSSTVGAGMAMTRKLPGEILKLFATAPLSLMPMSLDIRFLTAKNRGLETVPNGIAKTVASVVAAGMSIAPELGTFTLPWAARVELPELAGVDGGVHTIPKVVENGCAMLRERQEKPTD